MGVDYTPNYGIGFKVFPNPEKLSEDDIEYFADYLESELNTDYKYFKVGDGNYTGEKDDVYVVLKNRNIDFKIVDEKLDLLNEHLTAIGIETNERGLVGGLYIW